MKPALKRIAWGYVFMLLDFRINSFDLLPDWLGLLFIAYGCAKAAEVSGVKEFWTAQKAAALYFLYTIIAFFIQMNYSASPIIQAGERPEYNVTMLLVLIGQLIHLLLVYGLCSSIHAYAIKQEQPGLQNSASARWKVYLAFTTLYLVYLAFLPNIEANYTMAIVLIALAGFILEFFILLLIVTAVKLPYHKIPPYTDEPSS